MTSTSAAVASRVRGLRAMRSLTREDLAALCASKGHPELTYGALTNIERAGRSGRGRPVSVDELVALAAVLGTKPSTLLGIPPCTGSQAGFTCNSCGGAW